MGLCMRDCFSDLPALINSSKARSLDVLDEFVFTQWDLLPIPSLMSGLILDSGDIDDLKVESIVDADIDFDSVSL
jgi:hypothetical protein